jgi:tetratricopeptide (TPR) repeat protein
MRSAFSVLFLCSVALPQSAFNLPKPLANAVSSAFNPLGTKPEASPSTLPQLYGPVPTPNQLEQAAKAQLLQRLAVAQPQPCSIPLASYRPPTDKRFFFRAAKPANPNPDPGNPDLWTNLGADQYAEGRVSDAVSSFQRSIALAPSDGTPYYDLAQCALQQRRPELARRCLEAAVRVDPDYQKARRELATMGKVVGSR